MRRISNQTEAKLTEALEQVTDLVNDGEHPTAAIIKVASDNQILPGHIRLIVQAYNNGRTAVQRKSADDLYEKIATFPIADAKEVLEALYPEDGKVVAEKQATDAVSEDYSRSPSWLRDRERQARLVQTKVASTQQPYVDPEHLRESAIFAIRDLKTVEDRKRMMVSSLRDKVASCVAELDDYFRRVDAIPFRDVSREVGAYYGKAGLDFLSCISQNNESITKRASAGFVSVNWNKAPFLAIKQGVMALQGHARYRADLEAFQKDATTKIEMLTRLIDPKRPEPKMTSVMEDFVEKQAAGVGDAIKAVFALELARKVVGKAPIVGQQKTDDEHLDDTVAKFSDPGHESNLSNIRKQYMLSNLLANDDVISGYDPNEVVDSYNQLTQIAPRASSQEMLVRAMLRRSLAQGQVDTHEVDQLTGIENQLKQRDEPTDIRKMPSRLPYANYKVKAGSVLEGVDE
jgi:hypothetical protein